MPAVPRKPQSLTPDQQAALRAARTAQHRFERCQSDLSRASDQRLTAFRAAQAAGVSLGTFARELDIPKSTAQAILEGRGAERKRPR